MSFKVEILKHPTEEDWMLCKRCTLNTVGKDSTKLPTDEWKHKLLLSEHSPIRTLNFCIRMEIPYFVSVHYVRHFTGVTHFVQRDGVAHYVRQRTGADVHGAEKTLHTSGSDNKSRHARDLPTSRVRLPGI